MLFVFYHNFKIGGKNTSDSEIVLNLHKGEGAGKQVAYGTEKKKTKENSISHQEHHVVENNEQTRIQNSVLKSYST